MNYKAKAKAGSGFREDPFRSQHNKTGSIKKWFPSLAFKNLTLTQTAANIYGMNWSANFKPDLITKHPCCTLLVWLKGPKSYRKIKYGIWYAYIYTSALETNLKTNFVVLQTGS